MIDLTVLHWEVKALAHRLAYSAHPIVPLALSTLAAGAACQKRQGDAVFKDHRGLSSSRRRDTHRPHERIFERQKQSSREEETHVTQREHTTNAHAYTRPSTQAL